MRYSNFISGVVYLKNIPSANGINALSRELSSHFTHSELILCYDGSENPQMKEFENNISSSDCDATTIIYMGRPQGLEAAMNAGVDAAIGDFVLELDDIESFSSDFLVSAYEECCKGADIVVGECAKSSGKGRFFYPIFNRFSESQYKLTSSTCSLVSRRAINRIRSMSDYAPYRKAAYAACGLRVSGIVIDASAMSDSSDMGLAMDALALYTDAFYKISFGFSIFMTIVSLTEIIYVLATYAFGLPIFGWTTTMLAITFGFLGVFVILTFILKYVALILRMQSNRQGYLIEGVVKNG